MSHALAFRQLAIDGPEWPAAYALLRTLRPALTPDEFTARAREAQARDDYTVHGAFDGAECLGVAGVRRLVDLLHGAHLYVDDLVVAEAARSRGVGAALLRHAEELAAAAGGLGLRLCTGIDHWPARRFYEREGWTARAVAYKKGFPESPA